MPESKEKEIIYEVVEAKWNGKVVFVGNSSEIEEEFGLSKNDIYRTEKRGSIVLNEYNIRSLTNPRNIKPRIKTTYFLSNDDEEEHIVFMGTLQEVCDFMEVTEEAVFQAQSKGYKLKKKYYVDTIKEDEE